MLLLLLLLLLCFQRQRLACLACCLLAVRQQREMKRVWLASWAWQQRGENEEAVSDKAEKSGTRMKRAHDHEAPAADGDEHEPLQPKEKEREKDKAAAEEKKRDEKQQEEVEKQEDKKEEGKESEDKKEEGKEEDKKDEEKEEAKEDEKKGEEPEPEQVTCSHILVKHRESRRPSSWREERITRSKEHALRRIEKLRQWVLTGKATFEQVARHESDCSSAKRGGDLGPFRRGAMQKPFEDAAFGLKVGEMSGVVETNSGYHIIKRTA